MRIAGPRQRSAGARAGVRPRLHSADVVARIARYLEHDETASPRIPDLCAISGISERTLRQIFLDAFGMGPKRYLRTRKLHAIQVALAASDPRTETVAGVARRFGLSDVGRMATSYRALFGEYPRATLVRGLVSRGSMPVGRSVPMKGKVPRRKNSK